MSSEKVYTLEFYMKSGNVLRLTHVTECETESRSNGGGLVRVDVTRTADAPFSLLLSTLDISQVEGVVAARGLCKEVCDGF